MTTALRAQVAVISHADATLDRFARQAEERDQRFDAIWVPIAIVLAGAAAMTIYCNLRGYSGWSWKWTWRGVRASCV